MITLPTFFFFVSPPSISPASSSGTKPKGEEIGVEPGGVEERGEEEGGEEALLPSSDDFARESFRLNREVKESDRETGEDPGGEEEGESLGEEGGEERGEEGSGFSGGVEGRAFLEGGVAGRFFLVWMGEEEVLLSSLGISERLWEELKGIGAVRGGGSVVSSVLLLNK